MQFRNSVPRNAHFPVDNNMRCGCDVWRGDLWIDVCVCRCSCVDCAWRIRGACVVCTKYKYMYMYAQIVWMNYSRRRRRNAADQSTTVHTHLLYTPIRNFHFFLVCARCAMRSRMRCGVCLLYELGSLARVCAFSIYIYMSMFACACVCVFGPRARSSRVREY